MSLIKNKKVSFLISYFHSSRSFTRPGRTVELHRKTPSQLQSEGFMLDSNTLIQFSVGLRLELLELGFRSFIIIVKKVVRQTRGVWGFQFEACEALILGNYLRSFIISYRRSFIITGTTSSQSISWFNLTNIVWFNFFLLIH